MVVSSSMKWEVHVCSYLTGPNRSTDALPPATASENPRNVITLIGDERPVYGSTLGQNDAGHAMTNMSVEK